MVLSFVKSSVTTAVRLMNMGKFFYAVHRGWATGVFDTWAECQANVNKYPSARFKKFATLEEAEEFASCGSVNDAPSETYYEAYQPKRQYTAYKSYSGAGTSNSTGNYKYSSAGQTYKNGGSAKRARDELDEGRNYQDKTRNYPSFPQSSKRSRKTYHAPTRSYSSAASGSSQQVEVYTDGACTHNGRRGARAGIGVHWRDSTYNDISERLDGKQTNQRAELTAAIRAIEEADKRGVPKLKLHTDSKYTINCVTDWINRWKQNGWKTAVGKEVLNKDDIVQLDRLCEKVDVEWVYVPGHSNVPGNEMADQLARKGADRPL